MERLKHFKRSKPLLGTYVEITLGATDESLAQSAFERAFHTITELQNQLSFHDSESELTSLNEAPPLSPVKIPDDLLYLLQFSDELTGATDGLFDVTIAPVLIGKGFLPTRGMEGEAVKVGMKNVIIKDSVVIKNAPLLIDLGGIAKGYIVDRGIESLKESGVESGCINAGGDMRIFGGEPIPIHIRTSSVHHPFYLLGHFSTCAIATSATSNHRGHFSPIIDPRTLNLVQNTETITVIADRCVIADALTKVAALSIEKGEIVAEKYGAKIFRIGNFERNEDNVPIQC